MSRHDSRTPTNTSPQRNSLSRFGSEAIDALFTLSSSSLSLTGLAAVGRSAARL
jgi:hypothetical protein